MPVSPPVFIPLLFTNAFISAILVDEFTVPSTTRFTLGFALTFFFNGTARCNGVCLFRSAATLKPISPIATGSGITLTPRGVRVLGIKSNRRVRDEWELLTEIGSSSPEAATIPICSLSCMFYTLKATIHIMNYGA